MLVLRNLRSVGAASRKTFVKVIHLSFTHLLVEVRVCLYTRLLGLQSAKVAAQVPAHVKELGVVFKQRWTFARNTAVHVVETHLPRVASRELGWVLVLRKVSLVAGWMSRRPVQELSAPLGGCLGILCPLVRSPHRPR